MLLALLSLGCRPPFATVDEACHPLVKGDGNGSAAAVEVQHRVDCHRRLAGLDRVRLDPAITEAVEGHAAYMATNAVVDWQQDEELPGYTGQDVTDRLLAAEVDAEELRDLGLWELYGNRGSLSRQALVDQAMVASLYLREAVLQPTAQGAGYAEVDGYLDYVVAYDFPADARVHHPVVYPADGQIEVPPSYYAVEPAGSVDPEWLPYGALVGYPITLTFGGTDPSGSWGSTANVYGLAVEKLELEGPDGLVPVDVVVPDDGRSSLHYSVAVVPRAPLAVSTTYTLRAQGSKTEGDWWLETTFSTALDDTPANQELVEMLGGLVAPVAAPLAAGAPLGEG